MKGTKTEKGSNGKHNIFIHDVVKLSFDVVSND